MHMVSAKSFMEAWSLYGAHYTEFKDRHTPQNSQNQSLLDQSMLEKYSISSIHFLNCI